MKLTKIEMINNIIERIKKIIGFEWSLKGTLLYNSIINKRYILNRDMYLHKINNEYELDIIAYDTDILKIISGTRVKITKISRNYKKGYVVIYAKIGHIEVKLHPSLFKVMGMYGDDCFNPYYVNDCDKLCTSTIMSLCK